MLQAAGVKDVKYPLTACQKMAMMRNIEKMIVDALNDHTEVVMYRLSAHLLPSGIMFGSVCLHKFSKTTGQKLM